MVFIFIHFKMIEYENKKTPLMYGLHSSPKLPAEDEVLQQKLREESRAVFLQRKSRELLDNEELQVLNQVVTNILYCNCLVTMVMGKKLVFIREWRNKALGTGVSGCESFSILLCIYVADYC